jgi:hypothetical protein
MSLQLNGDTGVTFNDASLQGAAASPFGLKNRIINGAMEIDQRNAGASVTPTAVGNYNYTVDRWANVISQASKFSIQQSTTAPTGFKNSLLVTSLSAYSITSSDYFFLRQGIEGLNTADLAWGSAGAATVTLSFWVRSSLTGTFGGALANDAANRSYPFAYTISSANTWEKKTITIAGDTTGTWLTTNGTGINVLFGLGVGTTTSGTAGAWAAANYVSATGATSVVGTNGATFYITGVQLEQNTSATPFERRLYNQELANCQRYCIKFGPNLSEYLGYAYSTNDSVINFVLPVTMRTDPSFVVTGTWQGRNATNAASTATIASNTVSPLSALPTAGFTATQGTPTRILSNNSGTITFSAEL